MVTEDMSIEEIRAFFAGDRFAAGAGCTIESAEREHVVCEMPITPEHRNAVGGVMGGAIFTLADFCLAVASNLGEKPTVSASNTIEFMSAAKGDTLIAECTTDKSGRSLGFYTVYVRDNADRSVAKMTATCFRQ